MDVGEPGAAPGCSQTGQVEVSPEVTIARFTGTALPSWAHPLNRGGAMLSHHDCHQKGAKILAIGPDLRKIQASVAIELSNHMEKKKKQIAANEAIVHASMRSPLLRESTGTGWWFQTFFIFHFIYGMSSFPTDEVHHFSEG